MSAPVSVWFVRHGEVASHRGDVPLTERGLADAETAGERLAASLEPTAVVEFLHAPTQRTLQTAEALRRGIARTNGDAELGEPRVEQAIRNADVYVAGHRVETVSSVEALAEQLPAGTMTHDEVAANAFFGRFWAERDRIGVWLRDEDPPGERATDVARRLFTFARSLTDRQTDRPRHYVCVTHSGPLRAVLLEYVLDEDPGEPEYVESIRLELRAGCEPGWHFRDTIAAAAA
jgi:broad specificity phosphatase PhoE